MMYIVYLRHRVLNDYIEDQAPSLPPPPSRQSKLSLFLSLPVSSRSSLLTGEGGGVGNHKARKPGPLQIIQYSLI